MSEDGANDRTRVGTNAPRRLAAIVMGDIAGYSRLMGANERGTHERVQQLHRELIEPTITEHRGRVIRTRGDDFLAMFDSPVEAVRCAIVLQQAMVGRNLELPQNQWIRFRIGVNLGDVIVESTDIYGEGVNVAARLEQLAEPGTICISGGVYELVRYRLVCGYQSMGDTRLKNIADPVPVYRVLPDPASVAKATRSRVARYAVFGGAVVLIAGGVWFGWSRIYDHSATLVASNSQPASQPAPHPATPPPPPVTPPITVPPVVPVVADPPVDAKDRSLVAPPPPPAPTIQQAMVVPPPVPPSPPAGITEPEMIAIKGGVFHMGSGEDHTEQPIHAVTVGPFEIAKYVITLRQWRDCVHAKACSYAPEGDDDAPLSNVSWNDAQQYVKWLSSVTHHQYRLPTEAEWEFAVRGGTDTRYWWGNAMKAGLANCKGCDPIGGAVKPTKIGTRPPNQFGLYDIDSGITEWVQDCWYPDYRGAPADGSPRQTQDCRDRVIRGGAWNNDASYMRSASRDNYDASVRYPTHGFRVARSS
jgi:formylglycine-generating enzyme required for sulfatase activity/class 3 adenylate cyclase